MASNVPRVPPISIISVRIHTHDGTPDIRKDYPKKPSPDVKVTEVYRSIEKK